MTLQRCLDCSIRLGPAPQPERCLLCTFAHRLLAAPPTPSPKERTIPPPTQSGTRLSSPYSLLLVSHQRVTEAQRDHSWRELDCVRIHDCERAFIAEHRNAQGECPAGCAGYSTREERGEEEVRSA